MRYHIIPSFVLVCGWTICLADDAPNLPRPTCETLPDTIHVQFSGPLSTFFTLQTDADDESLTSATITAAGTNIYLDWSRSPAIRRELLWWSIPRAGDYRGPHAEVTGRMVFKPHKELDQRTVIVPAGVSANTPVPVVVVESIKVYLAGPDGKPRGPQPDRGRVKVESSKSESHRPEPGTGPAASGESLPPAR